MFFSAGKLTAGGCNLYRVSDASFHASAKLLLPFQLRCKKKGKKKDRNIGYKDFCSGDYKVLINSQYPRIHKPHTCFQTDSVKFLNFFLLS